MPAAHARRDARLLQSLPLLQNRENRGIVAKNEPATLGTQIRRFQTGLGQGFQRRSMGLHGVFGHGFALFAAQMGGRVKVFDPACQRAAKAAFRAGGISHNARSPRVQGTGHSLPANAQNRHKPHSGNSHTFHGSHMYRPPLAEIT